MAYLLLHLDNVKRKCFENLCKTVPEPINEKHFNANLFTERGNLGQMSVKYCHINVSAFLLLFKRAKQQFLVMH